MPLSPTPNMLLTLPTVGSDTDLWGTETNTSLNLVDAHDHSTGKGVKVKTSGINIDNDMSINSHVLYNVNKIAFDNISTLPLVGNNEIFVVGGNLYFKNNSGANVLITSGNSLSQTTVGGIAGDYSTVNAEVAFLDSFDTYTFKQQLGASVRQWAKMQSADLSLFEYKAQPAAGVPANSVTLKSPASLASSYTLTMPVPPLPAAESLLRVTSTGQIIASNTLTALITDQGGITFTGTAVATWATGTQALWQTGSQLIAQGIVDFLGASKYRLPPRIFLLDISSGQPTTAANATYNGAAHNVDFTGVTAWEMPIPLNAGDRITEISVFFRRDSGTTISLALKQIVLATNTASTLVDKDITTGAGQLQQNLSSAPTIGSLPQTLVSGNNYWFSMFAANTDNLLGVTITWDRPDP